MPEDRMGVEVGFCTSLDETIAALAPVWHYFGGPTHPADHELVTRLLEPSRMLAARDGSTVVGGAGSFALELTVPGSTVRAAGTTVVGVLPTHRRRGILRAMMRAHLDDAHARGEAVACLWASADTIYGRFGYGMASLTAQIEIAKHDIAFVQPFDPRSRSELVEEAAAHRPFTEVYERVRREHPGMIARSENWWRLRRLADPEHRRHGGGMLNRLLLTIDGRPEGYALYRIHQSIEGGTSAGFVSVIEAIGAGPEATRDLWRLLLDIDWVANIKASLLPLDHPLTWLLACPRLMKFRRTDGLWVRLVDVGAALAARRLGPGEPSVIEVKDAFCPWNTGRWRVSADGIERVATGTDLACDVTALGSVYLGGFTFAQLARAGRIEERRPGAAARADALFLADRAPWCPEVF
jgi:predicted acetyltransferase